MQLRVSYPGDNLHSRDGSERGGKAYGGGVVWCRTNLVKRLQLSLLRVQELKLTSYLGFVCVLHHHNGG